ncbi:uncharacterized protein K460DRAFT_397017 [Cucurbitaria berberidis CBS 394.84]|uniref:Uncharacterized protein n=1 Tax=Cucurbitaria berberidis CBS 394.84 TaxID=1168544 RepID=A0A9P4GDX6_9PLEO|nr:uncharacterized protein K460DRAFT_397017 [Cucurbitaria berberidis CBS 394.84]KAF1843795.1 hypothetical protein K460DRAFT_397017 [Cucurbitaria berberidis CBS 394.84]
MEPTLTLQIPFILLGRRDDVDPGLWNPDNSSIDLVRKVHEVLRQFCPEVPIQLNLSADIDTKDETRSRANWTIQPAPNAERPSSGPAHNSDDTDGLLASDESVRLGDMVWAYPMLLQRSNIPLSTDSIEWRGFEDEVQTVFKVLKWAFEDGNVPKNGIEEAAKSWSLICGKRCWISIAVIPPSTSASITTSLSHDAAKKLLMLATAFESELTMLSTPTALLEFWSLSRFLEYRGIVQLAKNRSALWQRLKDKKHLSDKRKGTIYQRDKEKWISGFDEEDIACERTKGRRREWWEVLDGSGLEELLEEMRSFEERGRRLALSCDFFSKEMKDTARGNNEEENIDSSIVGDRESHTKLPPGRPPQATIAVSRITFNGYRSSLDVEEILAYAELIASLVRLSYSLDANELRNSLEKFRESTVNRVTKPLDGFKNLMKVLCTSDRTTSFWMHKLSPYYTECNDTNIDNNDKDANSHYDPFSPLRAHISSSLAREKAFMPSFIQRYHLAGGFYPTKSKKLYALMVAEEHARKQKSGRRKKAQDWLGNLGDVGLGEAIYEEAVSPEATSERREETNDWVNEVLGPGNKLNQEGTKRGTGQDMGDKDVQKRDELRVLTDL